MFNQAQKQLLPITVDEVKRILKTHNPHEFDKMIIDNTSELKRTDFLYSELKYRKADRKTVGLSFPLFDSVKHEFSIYCGGLGNFGEKSLIQNNTHIDLFARQKGVTSLNLDKIDDQSAFEFPFEVISEDVSLTQKKYFLSQYTGENDCDKCKGEKYITCTNHDCQGKHEWQCKTCIGTGSTSCITCSGGTTTKCTTCHGQGEVSKTEWKGNESKKIVKKCGTCTGKGYVPCKSCGATGKTRCVTCDGSAKIICKHCYPVGNKRGMIDCPVCLTIGLLGQFVYVETEVADLKNATIIQKGVVSNISHEVIKKHVKQEKEFVLGFRNVNGTFTNNEDEISKELLTSHEVALNLSRANFPIVLKEEIYYQVIPCVKLRYTHILTNTEHEIVIVDFLESPEIIFLSNAEATKLSVKSVAKSASSLFSKVFKTKGFKAKEDRKVEIKLMIHLAKCDGKMEETEKLFLAGQIKDLSDFTNAEKQEFFALMNLEKLPELTKVDVKLVDKTKATEILNKLNELALYDGEFEPAEKELIAHIEKLFSEH
jgi:uncharacterized tellurite resistance protein B-like protein